MRTLARNIASFGVAVCVLSVGFAVQAQDKDADKREYKRILKEEDFLAKLIGKRLIYESGAVVIFLEDGTFGGSFSGSPVWGEWQWREDRICHQMNIGEKRYKVECKVPQLGKKRVRFIREDGSSYGIAKIR